MRNLEKAKCFKKIVILKRKNTTQMIWVTVEKSILAKRCSVSRIDDFFSVIKQGSKLTKRVMMNVNLNQ